MTLLALGLILAAALPHATWNLVAKRAGGGPVFVWLFGGGTLLDEGGARRCLPAAGGIVLGVIVLTLG